MTENDDSCVSMTPPCSPLLSEDDDVIMQAIILEGQPEPEKPVHGKEQFQLNHPWLAEISASLESSKWWTSPLRGFRDHSCAQGSAEGSK